MSVLKFCKCAPLIVGLSLAGMSAFGAEIFVGPEGGVDQAGTAAAPMSMDAALRKASVVLKSGPLKQPLEIILQKGTYPLTKAYTLGPEFKGTAEAPITIKAAPGAKVIFEGRANVADPMSFKKVTDPAERARLTASAADEILVATLSDPALISTLKSKIVLSLGIDDELYLPSVYPNEGYAQLNRTPTVNEVCPPGIPKKDLGYGVRSGQPPYRDMTKPKGWRGSLAEPCGAQAGIAEKEEEMAGSWAQWEAELKRDNTRHDFSGYYEAIWKLSSMKMYAASAEQKTLHMAQTFSYGFGWLKTQPFRVFGMLCELDSPGEWHFDVKTNRLYLYPTKPITPDTKIGLPVAEGFLKMKDNAYVRIEGLKVTNVGRGTVIQIDGGHHNLIAGCTLINCTATGATISGTHNGMRSCDLIDLNAHVQLGGGVRSPTEITPAFNYVENCHFYHKRFTHEKVNIAIRGVGNIFRNNLIHNSLGQAVVLTGNDHIFELNELFNIGYEEGDGGAVYSGADLAGYGIMYRHNFIHHLMRTPNKKLGRNGIHFDDFQAGATCIGNIFYKSCENGVCMNGGAGHTMLGNVFLEGNVGIFNRGNWGEKALRQNREIEADPNHDYAGQKEDYVGNTERKIGKKGWMNEPWASKYPLFKKVMSDEGEYGRLWPIYCTYKNNYYYGNRRNKMFEYRYPDSEEFRSKVVLENDIQGAASDFVDYENLNLAFAKEIDGIDPIPFERIGLYTDEYRPTMPDKAYYRRSLKKFFDGLPSYRGCPKRIDTSKLIEETPVVTGK